MGILADKDALARIQAATDYPLQRAEDGWVAGLFFNCRLSSVFQPVFDVSERRVVGHGASVRSEPIRADGSREESLSPWGIFALATEDPLLVRLDRLCRTLHALNYFSRAPGRQDLHVSVQSRLLESVKDVSAAVRAGADLLQGRYLGAPNRAIESVSRRAAADLQHPGYAW